MPTSSDGRSFLCGMGGVSIHFRRVLMSSMIGNALEWYDFMLYGYCATMIARLFFPSDNVIASMLATYGVFFIGFVTRPLGGILFGYLGDRVGRKHALTLSIYCMAIPTALIGALPTYYAWGVAAPILLTILRLFQGLSMGGEFTGSIIFVVEHAPSHRRGFWGSWTTFSCALGVLLGSAVCMFLSSILSEEQLYQWGWRIPFLLSIFGSLVGAFMRKQLQEPESFKKNTHSLWKPLFQNHWKAMLTVISVEAIIAVGFFTLCVFIVNFLQNFIHFSYFKAVSSNIIATVVFAIVIPFAGHFSDIWGRRRVMMTALCGFFLFSVPLFMGVSCGIFWITALSQSLLMGLLGSFFGVLPSVLVELFPGKVRCLGVALSHNIAMMTLGGTALNVCMFLIQKGTEKMGAPVGLLMPGFYLMLIACVSFVGVWGMKESFQKSID